MERMLYLKSTNELSNGKKTIRIDQDEFRKIFEQLLIKNSYDYMGEKVIFPEKFQPKSTSFDSDKELLAFINRDLIKSSLKEDVIIDKLVRALDETEKYYNYMDLKREEISTLINYSEGLDTKARELLVEYNEMIKSYQKKMENLLEFYANKNLPNLSRLTGYKVASRLISIAGGTKEIALSPSSSIQILGAEKAFFRFKKGKGNPPKHGIIYEIPDIYKSPKKLAGKIARTYANGIVKAARADLVGIISNVPEITKNRVEEIKKRKTK